MSGLSDIGQELPDMMSGYGVDIVRPAIVLGIPEEAFELICIALDGAIRLAFYLAGQQEAIDSLFESRHWTSPYFGLDLRGTIYENGEKVNSFVI